MSIFGSIVSKIFGHSSASAAPAPTHPSAPAAPAGGASAPTSAPVGGSGAPTSFNNPSAPSPAPGQTTAAAAPAGAAPASSQPVDVEAILNDLASKNAQKLDWRHSIVDMMKLLGLDSSLSARQALAKELNYTGSMDDSASMNIWLHKQVMQKLAANGGKVPDDLR